MATDQVRIEKEVHQKLVGQHAIGTTDGSGDKDCCYVHVNLEVQDVRETGEWQCSGEVHMFFVAYTSTRKSVAGKDAKKRSVLLVEDLTKHFAYRMVSVSDNGEAVLLEEVQGSLLRKFDPLSRSSSETGSVQRIFYGMECSDWGVQSVTYYQTSGIVHMTYYFRNGKFSQTHLESSFSPFDRRGLRLELLTAFDPPYTHFDPLGLGDSIRFVASPVEELTRFWPTFLPGVALLLHKPIEVRITRKMSLEWTLGPCPTLIQGVDFTRGFSVHPVYVIPIERRVKQYARAVFCPMFLVGCFGLLSLSNIEALQESTRGMVGLVPALVALVCMVLLRGTAWNTTQKTSTWFLDIYFLLSIAFLLALSIFSILISEDSTRSTLLILFAVAWCVSHFVLALSVKTSGFRGHWEQVIADSKLTSNAKPDEVALIFHAQSSKTKIVPAMAQSALEKVAKTKQGQQILHTPATEAAVKDNAFNDTQESNRFMKAALGK